KNGREGRAIQSPSLSDEGGRSSIERDATAGRPSRNALTALGAVPLRSPQGHLPGLYGQGAGLAGGALSAQHERQQGAVLAASLRETRPAARQHHPGGSARSRLQPSISNCKKYERMADPRQRGSLSMNCISGLANSTARVL